MKFKKKKLNKNPFAVQINPDPKKSAEFFNMAMNTGDTPTGPIGVMGESLEKELADAKIISQKTKFSYDGKFFLKDDTELGRGHYEVNMPIDDKQKAINEIIKKYKLNHFNDLPSGWKTNVFLEEDKLVNEGPTDEALRAIYFIAANDYEKETKVDDPKYNFDDNDRKDNYEVK